MLAEHHGFKVSRETLRKWMQEDGIWLSRKQRRTFHQPRQRRERYGELIQIDGSDHHWFEDRADPCTLLVFIDDATSMLMELRFVQSESTFSYSGALDSYLLTHGRHVAFYSSAEAPRLSSRTKSENGRPSILCLGSSSMPQNALLTLRNTPFASTIQFGTSDTSK